MVFAAKAVKDATVPGGFKWVAVGNGTLGQTNVLDTGGNAHHLGSCAETADAERACSLNRDPHASAQEPRVAAGTMAPGGVTSPWVTWDEEIGGGRHAIFVSRLAGDHFEVLNNGQPVSNTVNDSVTPDITFSHNTPYVSWVENVNGQERAFLGHFEGPGTAPVFKLDTPGGIVRTAAGVVEQRVPLSSTCTANPFNADGAACQGSAVGTPFFLHTAAGDPQRLFSDAYLPAGVTTLAATGVGSSSATVNGSVNPAGAPVRVHFEFGDTPAYGASTTPQDLGVGSTPVGVSAAVANLPASTTVHYRLVAQSDFATVVGADQVLVTAAAPPAPPSPNPPAPPAPNPPTKPAPNVAPTLGLALYKPTVALHRLAKPRKLVLHLSVSERSTVTVQLLKGKKQLKRLVTKRAGKGAFTLRLPLLGIKAGTYTVRITARDPQGLARIKTKSLHLVR